MPAASAANRAAHELRVQCAIDYIDTHLAEPLDLAVVARAAGFSPFHFHRVFAAATGENPQDYVSRLRLERAANLLVKSPSLSITAVAAACGFSSGAVFARAFKKYFGAPAGQYARKHRSPSVAPAWVAARPQPDRHPAHDLPPVQVRGMPSVRLAYFAARGGYAAESIRQVWLRLFAWAQAQGLPAGPGRLVGISFDDPEITPPHKCRYYAGLVAPDGVRVAPPASVFDFPEQTCAVCRLDCDADQIQPAYRRLYRDWLPESGYLLADLPSFEIYYNAPDADPASKYVLDVCIPLVV